MTSSIQLQSLLMAIIVVCTNSAIHASAWMVSSAEASVAAPATSDNKVLKDELIISGSGSIYDMNRMYVEAPPAIPFQQQQQQQQQKLPFFVFHDLEITKLPFLNIFAPPPLVSSSSSEASSEESLEASWSHSIQDDSVPCTYKPIWDWQTEYLQEHLTNFQEMELPDPSLATVQTTTTTSSSSSPSSTRVRTKWYSSEEYRLIRMTYMDGGDRTQIFTTVCYPRTIHLPILGHGLLQVGDRRITISDFQPLEESHNTKYADRYLQPIKDQYPSLGQEMSERFFQQGEFWSDSTLLGRFSKTEEDEEMWKDLWPAYKACVQTHVQLCQEHLQEQQAQEQRNTSSNRISNSDDDESSLSLLLLQKHAEYDAHVASRDPAIKMLTGIFGEETATKVVYEALFPLANPPSLSLQQ